MRRLSVGIFLTLSTLVYGSGQAETYDQSMALQRSEFKAAERAFDRKDVKEYERLKARLSDYPLYPYLVYEELVRNLARTQSGAIGEFLDRWEGSPLADRLRSKYLDVLAQRGDWREYLAFDAPSESASRQCRTVWAMYKTGERAAALDRVEPLWLYGKSRPKECDAVFKAWKEAGKLTPERVWARIHLAMKKRNWQLANYLKRELPKDDQRWVDVWVKAWRSPDSLNSIAELKQNVPLARRIVISVLKRLAQRDTDKAIRLWEPFEKTGNFSARDRASLARTIGVHLALDRDMEALHWFAFLPIDETDKVALGWAVRVCMVNGEWNKALYWLNRMPEDLREDQQWRYWRGRVLQELGRDHEANKYFAGVSLNRSYYGFLAADHVGAAYEFEQEVLEPTESMRQYLETKPGVLRARELYALDKRLDARREWWVLDRSLNPDELRVVAKLAQEWGWHDRAILTVARGGHFDDLALRFPLAFSEHIHRYADLRDLDRSWVYAVCRQESAFSPDVRSHAGATGLMQLMPATAKRVAKQINTSVRHSSDLTEPELNVRLGTYYLRSVYDDLAENPVLATAAYNAGPHRVRKWLPETGKPMPADLWVELVPFNETREYLRRVLAYSVIYDMRRGLETPRRISERMPAVVSLEEANRIAEQKASSPRS
ncbi:MAG: transglycosylase SLT domain-containing protein [Gammaproteobacteria bacterium]|nr:transglycosylase SLT domain-containing protein [Gammaproteobacteria bacterium]MCP5136999.1 transglycosylase SLT domain-containing protein [Gammaproteobacteria bacterium]